jgi:hypothetical protein
VLPLDDLRTWLAAKVPTATVVINWAPTSPDAVVVIQSVQGGRSVLDDAFEESHISVRCRDATDAAAETMAMAVHGFLVALGSTTMGTTRVLSSRAITGPPAFFIRDQSGRTTYLGGYTLTCPV